MSKNTEKVKAELMASYEAKIAEINQITATATASTIETLLSQLKDIEKEYAGIVETEAFTAAVDAKDLITTEFYESISHRKETVEGHMTGVSATTKLLQVDLKKYCDRRGIDTTWFYEMQALNKRLTLKVAMDIGTPTEIRDKINDDFLMDSMAEQIQLGKTPTSNTACVKHMQTILDMLIPDGAGKVNNHDLAYVMLAMTRLNKKDRKHIVCAKHRFLQGILTSVFNRVITGGYYTPDYEIKKKVVSEAAAPVSNPERAEESEKAEEVKG